MEQVAPGWAMAIVKDLLIAEEEVRVPDNPGGKPGASANCMKNWIVEANCRWKNSGKIAQLQSELFNITAELVEGKKSLGTAGAPRHSCAATRRSGSWRAYAKVGKGTGKRAHLQGGTATPCRLPDFTVPVWIMPINYVTRNF